MPDGSGVGVQAQRFELEGEIGTGERLIPWFNALAQRLARVVVLNRDWKAALTPTVLREDQRNAPLVGILLDPPYRTEGRNQTLYESDMEGSRSGRLKRRGNGPGSRESGTASPTPAGRGTWSPPGTGKR